MTHIVLWKKLFIDFCTKKKYKKNKNLEEHRKSIFMRVCDWKKKASSLHNLLKLNLTLNLFKQTLIKIKKLQKILYVKESDY